MRSRSKETRKSRSRSRSGTPVRGKSSPRGGKGMRSPGAGRVDTLSPKRKGGVGAVRADRKDGEMASPGNGDQVHSESAAKNVSSENGIFVSKSIVVDEVVMEVKSSLNTKLDTATILRDLEDKRRQQSSGVEDSSNAVLGGVPPSEAGVGAEMKGFKKPVKKGSKERTLTADDANEEEETEVIDDWRDDIKSQGREKAKSKDKKERSVSKATKEEEERLGSALVEADSGTAARRDVQNGKEYDYRRDAVKRTGGLREVQMETVKEVGGEGQAKESKLPRQPVNGAEDRTREVPENISIARFEFLNDKVEKSLMERNLVSEMVVSTNIREEKVVPEVHIEETSVVESVKQNTVLEEVEGTLKAFGEQKDPIDSNTKAMADVEMDEDVEDERESRQKTVEASVLEDNDNRSRGGESGGVDGEGDDRELGMRKKLLEAGEEEKSRDRRARKKSREGDEEEDGDKRRKKKSQEGGDVEEDVERHRRRRHQKKHRHEDDAEKGEEEDEEEDAEQRKERRRHKKKHRKDDVEKKEKKRRKHRHHRRKRSPSESREASPSGGHKVKEGNDDDDTTKQKSSRSRRSPGRSPSVEAEKGAVESDEGVTRKKSSSRSHKKKRREPSKSQSESPSSSD